MLVITIPCKGATIQLLLKELVHPTDPTIYMMEADVSIQTRAKKYETTGSEPTGKELMGTSTNPLQIDRLASDYVPRPPKASIKHATHNPIARDA